MATSSSNAGAGYQGINLTDMLQECFACGVLTIDAQGKVVALTPLAQRLLSQPADQTQLRSAAMLPAPIRAIIEEAQKSGQWVAEREIAFQSKGATTTTLSVTAIPLSLAARTTHVVVLLKDVSSTRKLEQHMHRLDRLASIGTLSASMAHEIKNALVPVKTFVGLTLEENPEAELAGTARREMERVDGIVSRMLKFAAPAKPAFAAVQLHELLEHSLHLVQHRVEGKQISFTRQFNAASDSCSGDDHQLEQAFVNLLLNAVEAMGSEGAITVRTDLVTGEPGMGSPEPGGATRFLRVEIIDTGVGIAAEKIGSIFEPFFTTKPHGTGLGLAVTRRVIEEHSGVIHVKSQPGKGTTFTVLLPANGKPG
jgi:two-component system sensor histidine kinase HydH